MSGFKTPTTAEIGEIARAAGALTLQYFRRKIGLSEKSGNLGIVTEADLASEKMIKEWITKNYPGQSILAEESGITSVTDGPLWFIDPIDGTTNFSRGDPHYAITIAFGVRRGDSCEVMTGITYKPVTGEMFRAEKGRGCFHNDKPVKVSSETNFRVSSFRTGMGPEEGDELRRLFESIHKVQARLANSAVRITGSAALDLAYVAAGFSEGFWEPELNPWDIAAGVLMIREAGGVVTNFKGEQLDVLRDRGVVTANPKLHAELIELVGEKK